MFERLRLEFFSGLAALGLLSRIPVGHFAGCIAGVHRRRAAIYYPWVGLLIGGLLAFFAWLLPGTWSPILQAALLLTAWVGLTGALHLDGLADSADGWVGGMGCRRRTLAIMREPNVGPAAVVALILALLLKLALLAQGLECVGGWGILLVPALARAWLLSLLGSTAYVRGAAEAGMAAEIAAVFPARAAAISFALIQAVTLLLAMGTVFGLWSWLLGNFFALLLGLWLRRAWRRRLGGYTGDLLGAFVELQELVWLLALVLILC